MKTPSVAKVLIASLCSGFLISSIAIADQGNGIKLNTQPATPTPQALATRPIVVPPAPNINAKAYVLMDVNSGKIIAQKNMDQRRPPASLTKLMTLYIVEQSLAQGQVKIDDKVRIAKDAWATGGSRMFLKLGSHVPISDLVEGVIVASGNDACVALADYIAGTQSSFAHLMNITAARLGMNNTHYTDATGLPHPNHYSTAHDLAILARHVIKDYPQYYSWYKQKWISWNGIKQPNRNRLLWRDKSVDGLKTGHTKAAGYCLISSGQRNGMRLVSIVMGAPTDSARANDSQALLNWGFRFYNTYKLFDGNKKITQQRVWLGANKYVPLGLTQDMYVTIPSGDYKALKANMQVQPNLYAPVIQGQSYGKIAITLNGKTIETVPLIAMQNDAKGGWWTRTTDHISHFFRNIF